MKNTQARRIRFQEQTIPQPAVELIPHTHDPAIASYYEPIEYIRTLPKNSVLAIETSDKFFHQFHLNEKKQKTH